MSMFGKDKKEKKQKRFIIKEEQSLGFGAISIVVDTKTGVNYLASGGAEFKGITPLLDAEGKVVVDEISSK